MHPRLPAILALAILLIVTVGAQPRADLVLLNGRIFTGVPARPWAEALAIAGDRILALGTTDEIRRQASASARMIDLSGRLVVPGLNDAHAHPGTRLKGTDLEGPPAAEHDPTLDEILRRLTAAVRRTEKGGWIFGEIGPAVLDDPGATRFALDKVAAGRLVMLEAWSGHGTLFNTAALRHLGVRDDEPDPPGGFYRRLPGSRTISGVAHEYAEYRLRRTLSLEAGTDAQRAAFRDFARDAAALGVTSVQAMMTAMPAADAARLLAGLDLPVRMRLIEFPMRDMKAWQPSARPAASPQVRVTGIKWILDGTPLERLMFVRDPYADRETRGRTNFAHGDLTLVLQRAHAAGEQPLVHAVGDGAIDEFFDALEATGGERWRALRPRIEHGDLLQPDQFARARRLGVVVVQNPSHFMIPQIMRTRLGASRTARAQAVKSTLAAGIPLALGSDGPMNPFLNLLFATTHAVNPAEALTREQAVSAYTRGSAFAERQEIDKGTLETGKLADLAVLSQDIFSVAAEALPRTTSVLTIVGGRIVHERP